MSLSTLCRTFIVPIVGAVVALTAATTVSASAAPLTSQLSTSGLHRSGHTLKYVALGDSLAAGLGYAPVPDATAEDLACGRSTEAYAYSVNAGVTNALRRTGLSLTTTLAACQRATTSNLLQSQTINNLIIKPQLDQAYEGGAPHLLTITSGANDVQWARFIAGCFAPANCNTPENTAALNTYIDTMEHDMRSTMQSIKDRSRFVPPLVVATGYYNPLSTQCVNSNLSTEEIAWIAAATTRLNMAVRKTTQGEHWFARFAPVDFNNHDICSVESWIQRPGEPAPFHPTSKGQQAIATAILSSIGIRP